MQENPRINWQDRQKITFHGSACPKEISQQCTPATHTEAVHCQRVLLGVFRPCLWPLKAPGSTFGGGSPSLSSALWRQYPRPDFNPVAYKIWGKESTITRQKRRMRMIWGSIWLICDLEWNKALLAMALTSGADDFVSAFSSHRRTFWIFTATQISRRNINLLW